MVFVGGGIAHLVLGSVAPDAYAAFGETALVPALQELWANSVMPNIRARASLSVTLCSFSYHTR